MDELLDFQKVHTACICASKGQGKSTLINKLLTSPEIGYFQNYAKVYIISPTFHQDEAYQFELSQDQISPEIDDEFLDGIIEEKMSDEFIDENFIILFDDCISDANMKRSKVLKQILLNSRHYGSTIDGVKHGITMIFLTQHLKSLPTYLRQNMNYLYFFNTANHDAMKTMYLEYFAFLSYKDFVRMFRMCTQEKYSFLLTDGVHYWKKFNRLQIKDKGQTDRVDIVYNKEL